jgi:rifampicin phosphotransferase
MSYILPLSILRRGDLALAGGKGANLGELLAAGLPVPDGFCILTDAYRAFVAANGLEAEIQRQSAAVDLTAPDTLETASAAIRAAFETGWMPGDIVEEIRAAYQNLSGNSPVGAGFKPALPPADPSDDLVGAGFKPAPTNADAAFNQESKDQAADEDQPPKNLRDLRASVVNNSPLPVAVRSSATAEDLPDLSFAGQQDTYLNIVGEEPLLRAVVRCWASLWTARAIGYRVRNAISHENVALAVVVQAMLPSEASGVLFTVNPLSGRRSEIVIDATLGLGEALVSGQVEPDHYVVTGGQVTEKRLGAKALSIRGQAGGGTLTVAETASAQQALPDADILRLAALGQQAAAHFGGPQDVEWSWTAGKMWLVQSRPVTSLFPLPEHHRGPDHLMVLVNFGAVQGVMDPITPLGRDMFLHLAPELAHIFGSNWTPQTQTVVYEVAERLFLDINGAIRSQVGKNIVWGAFPAIEPGSMETLRAYRQDPRLTVRASHWGLRHRLRLVRVLGPNALRILANLAFPAARLKRIQAKVESTVLQVKIARAAAEKLPGSDTLADPAGFMEQTLQSGFPRMFLWLVSTVATGQVAFQPLRGMTGKLPEGERLALEVMRGLPHNVTSEMDLALWHTAQAIRRDPASVEYFGSHPASQLAADYQAGRLPAAAQSAVAGFLGKYGVRGVGEIDLGRIRWREDPTSVLQSLASYLKITDPQVAPDVVFARGADTAQRAIQQIGGLLRREKGGWWKAPVSRWLAGRARAMAGLRETPKFTIIRVFGEFRGALLDTAAVWVKAGWLERAEDVAFLRFDELRELARLARPRATVPSASGPAHWRELVAGRRAVYEREQRRRQAPRLLIGDGLAVYAGVGGQGKAGDKVLLGDPVSPGQVEGRVHVVLDPLGAQLAPGEILVCPGTDPAWTPLFLSAGGLVMEVGGLMTHGSVVAREYGIPAVVGVGQCTLRLTTGQRVRVDGSAGTVTILEG